MVQRWNDSVAHYRAACCGIWSVTGVQLGTLFSSRIIGVI